MIDEKCGDTKCLRKASSRKLSCVRHQLLWKLSWGDSSAVEVRLERNTHGHFFAAGDFITASRRESTHQIFDGVGKDNCCCVELLSIRDKRLCTRGSAGRKERIGEGEISCEGGGKRRCRGAAGSEAIE